MGKINFISVSGCITFGISSENKYGLYFLLELLSPFCSNSSSLIIDGNYYQKNTSELRGKIDNLVLNLAKSHPQIYKLKDFFNKALKPNEHFCISIDKELKQSELLNIQHKLVIMQKKNYN